MITPFPASSLPTPTPPASSRFFQILLHPQDAQALACLVARPVHPDPQRSSWIRAARCEVAWVCLPRLDLRHPWRGLGVLGVGT